MGLYNNNPYSNLHELNLDWIISKLKDVDKAQTAAEAVVDLVDRAEAAAAAAALSEEHASTAEDNAGDYADAANDAKVLAVAAKDLAVQYKDDCAGFREQCDLAAYNAIGSANDAHDDALAAAASASDAHDDAVAAAGSASDAHNDAVAAAADADRAQLYGASTGVMCFNGEVSAQSAIDVAVGYGTYIVVYFCDNTANSSGMHMIRHKSGNFKNRNLLTNGGAPMPISLTQSGTSVHVYAGIADGTMYFVILGYADA